MAGVWLYNAEVGSILVSNYQNVIFQKVDTEIWLDIRYRTRHSQAVMALYVRDGITAGREFFLM